MRFLPYAFALGTTFAASMATAADAPQGPPGAWVHKTAGPAFRENICDPSRVNARVAESHFTIGREAIREVQPERALEALHLAYEKNCEEHGVLIDLARAYELARRFGGAAWSLEAYLNRNKSKLEDEDRKTFERRIKLMNDAQHDEDEKTAHAAEGRLAKKELETQPSVLPWVVTGVGGAAMLVGGVVLGIGIANKPDGCGGFLEKTECQGGSSDDTKRAAGNAHGAQLGGLITLLGGTAILATGLVWHFIDAANVSAEREKGGKGGAAKVRITPVVGPGYTGGALSATF
jgi:hypothetical protein